MLANRKFEDLITIFSVEPVLLTTQSLWSLKRIKSFYQQSQVGNVVRSCQKKEKIGFTKVLQKFSFIPRIRNRYFVFSVRNVALIIVSPFFSLDPYIHVKWKILAPKNVSWDWPCIFPLMAQRLPKVTLTVNRPSWRWPGYRKWFMTSSVSLLFLDESLLLPHRGYGNQNKASSPPIIQIRYLYIIIFSYFYNGPLSIRSVFSQIHNAAHLLLLYDCQCVLCVSQQI